MTGSLTDLVKAASEGATTGIDPDALRDDVVTALKGVYDPEIPVDVYELGLIYKLDVSADGRVDIDMTLTAPNCPVADEIPRMVARAVEQVDGVTEVAVELVWSPPWDRSRMSEVARLELDMF